MNPKTWKIMSFGPKNGDSVWFCNQLYLNNDFGGHTVIILWQWNIEPLGLGILQTVLYWSCNKAWFGIGTSQTCRFKFVRFNMRPWWARHRRSRCSLGGCNRVHLWIRNPCLEKWSACPSRLWWSLPHILETHYRFDWCGHAVIPGFDHQAFSDVEFEGLACVAGGVFLLSVCKGKDLVTGKLLAALAEGRNVSMSTSMARGLI